MTAEDIFAERGFANFGQGVPQGMRQDAARDAGQGTAQGMGQSAFRGAGQDAGQRPGQGSVYSAFDSRNQGPALEMDQMVAQEMDRLLNERSSFTYRFDGLPNVQENVDMSQESFRS